MSHSLHLPNHEHAECSHHNHDHTECSHHNHNDPKKFSGKIANLDSDERRAVLPPDEILGLLDINSSSATLDAGAGTGFFTIPAARLTNGAVYAADLDKQMLSVIEVKAAAEGLSHITTLQESIDALSLPDSSVDIVLVSCILHEVPSLTETLKELNRVLKPGGTILCIEYEKEESSVQGPPMEIRIPSDLMKKELSTTGFAPQQCRVPSESMYIITAQKL